MFSDNQTSRQEFFLLSEIRLVWPKAPNCYYIYEIQFSGYFFLIQVIFPESYVIAALWEDLKIFFAPVKTRKCNENSCNEFCIYKEEEMGLHYVWK